MKKLLPVLLVSVLLMAGCSSNTLHEAISDTVYGEFDNPEILYQDDHVGIVIFLTKNENGDFIICRSSYEKNSFNRYELETGSDDFFPVELGKKSQFITMNTIGENTDNPYNVIWGAIFHYPGATQVAYQIHNYEGTKLFQNNVAISKKHIFIDVIDEQISDSYTISYDVVDKEGNVLSTYN